MTVWSDSETQDWRTKEVIDQLRAFRLTLYRNDFIFGGGDLDNFSRWFFMKRWDLAQKLENPRMAKVSFEESSQLPFALLGNQAIATIMVTLRMKFDHGIAREETEQLILSEKMMWDTLL